MDRHARRPASTRPRNPGASEGGEVHGLRGRRRSRREVPSDSRRGSVAIDLVNAPVVGGLVAERARIERGTRLVSLVIGRIKHRTGPEVNVVGRGERPGGPGKRRLDAQPASTARRTRVGCLPGKIDNGCYRDGHRGDVAVHGAVVGPVGEAVGSAEVRVRRVGEAAVGVQCQRTVRRAAHLARRQRIAIAVRIVTEDAGGSDRQRRTLVGRVCVSYCGWRVVGRRSADEDLNLDVVYLPEIAG